jgi:putative membrane protein
VNKAPSFREYTGYGIKGMAMGAANVIPGVSGGTIALITGIFEKLINSLKSINLKAAKLLLRGRFREFARQIELDFLVAVFTGILISIYSIAKVLEFLFLNYPVFVWAFFFGLILASVFYVGRTISSWKISVVSIFIAGAAIAVAISLFKPAQENTNLYYLFICGIVAICSMILPGLSGSFVLILMGNYQLIMIEAVTRLDWEILIPVGIGAVAGLLPFSHLLSWIFRKFKDQTIALLSGFMAGSLLILWPWKTEIYSTGLNGDVILNRSGNPLLEGYKYNLPDLTGLEFWISLFCIFAGILAIVFIEWQGSKKSENEGSQNS